MSKNNQPDLDEIWHKTQGHGHRKSFRTMTEFKTAILTHYISKQDAIKAFEKYLFDYVGDYTDKDIERFKLILERAENE